LSAPKRELEKARIEAEDAHHPASVAKTAGPVDHSRMKDAVAQSLADLRKGISRFYNSIDRATRLKETGLIDFFVYYFTVEVGNPAANATSIIECFRACDLTPPTSTSAYLSRGLKSTPQKFIRVDGGYRLERHYRESISKRLGSEQIVVQTNAELRKLESKLSSEPEREFLKETIACFEAGASRAAIIMCWILIMDHLFELVRVKHLASFNAELGKVTDRRVKVSAVSTRDDFGDIPEAKFIELLRASGIISNDVRKILDQKLGTRNSCAHPSGVTINRSKVIDFVEDLVHNVILKYPI
jgi:hypothetical protein